MEKHPLLFNTAYLRSVWARDYQEFKTSTVAEDLYVRLKNWAEKVWQKETASENSFIDLFFKQTWGYVGSGESAKKTGYTLYPQYPVKGAGQKGGTGEADIALGHFGRKDMEEIPRVLGEFKDDRSGLDKPQVNRPNDRSPVDQCLDYLREARTGLISPVLPTWGIVTDMNEFRLYIYGNKTQYQRFVIKPAEGDLIHPLIADNEDSAFQRFLFYRLFHSHWLLTTTGDSGLKQLLDNQIVHEQALENEFYAEYHAYREEIYRALRRFNPQYEEKGLLRLLVRFTQRILDRCLFILYCEDMGRELNYPPNILREALREVSVSQFYNPDAEDAWTRVKALFASMRDGTPFGQERINRFNGGLFEKDPEMDALILPNRIFCEHNQGQSPTRLLQYPKTLLYFSTKYNFGAADDAGGRTLTLTALGRIFEQSITDLEVMEAYAEGRASLTELTKRKRDGVYYTPEWVTHYIVEQTVGTRLSEIREELGFDAFADITEEQIKEYRKSPRKSKLVGEYKKALDQYSGRLNQLKVVDPACGSGAFLIQAFKYLYEQRQWVAKEAERLTGQMGLFDIHSEMRGVLSSNLYGVDINAESVEITRLALWLYTAQPGQPLTTLDENVRCGNSLIGHDFYAQLGINQELFGEDEKNRVNTFDWESAFPEVFEGDNPGFDCVIGNPPYVKLQHFRKIQEDVAEYLLKAKRKDGNPLYESTQTGNFDIYLPFIERGVELLNKEGKMGYIAPSVWLVNEYGKGLRQKIKRTRRLDRWVDFKSFQVFEEAITYTALQFFIGAERHRIRCVFAPNGKQDIASLVWQDVKDDIAFKHLPEEESWTLAPNAERNLLYRLKKELKDLGSKTYSKQIFQGLITSADYIYHLERIGRGKYRHKPKGKKAPVEIEIEDDIMHPLVSGQEAKRYQVPDTSTYILFPYKFENGRVRLFTETEMVSQFPKAWTHLKTYEKELRSRERGKFDDEQWFQFGRNQNIDKQENPKLMVPRLIIRLFTSVDKEGSFYLDNVDVNGILVNDSMDLFFLAGILNAPVANFVWRRISKPFQNDYRSANKQFIAPLPIPNASEDEKAQVIEKAKKLQELHTKKRDLIQMIDKRLSSAQCEDDKRDASWMWSDVKPLAKIKKDAPPELKGRKLTDWAKSQRELKLDAHLDRINPLLRPGAKLTAATEYGELKLFADGSPIIEGIFLSDNEVDFIAAQWRQKARQTNVSEKFDAKRLLNLLLKLRKTENPAIKEQVVKIDSDIQTLDEQIDRAETGMNRLTYELYKLTDEEIRLVESG